MAPLTTEPEESNWSLGESGSFYDQLGVTSLDQDDEVMTDIGHSYLCHSMDIKIITIHNNRGSYFS
jgi:hypothetical protein